VKKSEDFHALRRSEIESVKTSGRASLVISNAVEKFSRWDERVVTHWDGCEIAGGKAMLIYSAVDAPSFLGLMDVECWLNFVRYRTVDHLAIDEI
jgi:hypothetical protein